MWSTGGIQKKSNYRVRATPEGRRVCNLCLGEPSLDRGFQEALLRDPDPAEGAGLDLVHRLLAEHPVRLVGSTLTKEDPRDLDFVVLVPDRVFVEAFGDIDAWLREGRTGEWTEIRHSWSAACVSASYLLLARLGAAKMVDLKFIPAGMPNYGRDEIRPEGVGDPF